MKQNAGFTLIQIMIVISIIIILSSIIWLSVDKAMEKANIAKSRVDIQEIIHAMLLYRGYKGEFPPIGDNCSACSNPCSNSWTLVIDVLIAEGLLGARLDKDPWDNYYCYDDNDNECCGGCTPIYSMGPNGVNDSWFNCPRSSGCPQSICDDDVGEILPHSDRPNPW